MTYKTNLKQLTKEDWNRLFPIELVDHDPKWSTIFENEKRLILDSIKNDLIPRVEHFGSSSIPGIKSKPYIDMLIEIPEHLLFDEALISQFMQIGYTHFKVPAREGIDAYMSFGKGYRLDGKKAQIFHIHMCPPNHKMWDQLRFRDFLIANPDQAKKYESLKLELMSKYRYDRGAYVLGKTDFIKEILAMI